MSRTVSVIVPHYNDLAGLAACLEALDRQTVRPDEIVVADNNSPVGETAVAQVIAGRARLVVVTEQGAGPARNGGVAASTGELLAFTDSDCIPAPDWLEKGLAALPAYDFVGGGMDVLVADERRLTGAEAFERVFAFDNETYVLRKGFSVTANLICPRALFDKVGGFRTGVSEDLEWCLRAGSHGYRIGYAADARVGHPARRTWAEMERKWRRLNAEAYALAFTRPQPRLRWLMRSLILPLSALAHTPKVLASRKLGGAGDRARGLAMLYRLRLWRTVDYLRLLAEGPRS